MILAWPARSVWPRWAMIPYLALAEVQNTALAAILTFSDRVIYPAYAVGGRETATSRRSRTRRSPALIMWVPGSVAFLLPTLWLVVQTLAPARPAEVGLPRS